MDRRAQVAVEFLTTYGWVLAGIVILIAVLLYYGVFDPLRFVSRQCNFEPGLPCTSYKLESNQNGGAVFIVQLSNNLGYDISLPSGSILLNVENIGKPGKQTYAGTCSPTSPYIIKTGETFTCIVPIPDTQLIPSVGKNVQLRPQITYQNCLTASNYVTTGNCSAAGNFTSSGSTVTQMEPFSGVLYCGDGICSPQIGENPTTCPADCAPPASITLNASPEIVAPNGVNYSTITAHVLGNNNNPLPNTNVVFYTAPIGVLSQSSATTDSNGNAIVTITSQQQGTADITGVASGLSNTTNVLFSYVPGQILLTQTLVAPCSNSVNVTATLLDQQGNPMPKMAVSFYTNATGTTYMAPPSNLTDSSGNVQTVFSDSNLTSEVVNLTAVAYVPALGTNINQSVKLDFTPSNITLSSNTVAVCGSADILATLTDKYGNPVCNAGLNFGAYNNSGLTIPFPNMQFSPSVNTTDNTGTTHVAATYTGGIYGRNGVLPFWIYVQLQGGSKTLTLNSTANAMG